MNITRKLISLFLAVIMAASMLPAFALEPQDAPGASPDESWSDEPAAVPEAYAGLDEDEKEIVEITVESEQLSKIKFVHVDDENSIPIPTDIIVTAYYSDGSTGIIDSALCSFRFEQYGWGLASTRQMYIVVTYDGRDWETWYGYTVILYAIPALSIVTVPDKTVYQVGEEPDITGLTVREVYEPDDNYYSRVVDGTVREHGYLLHPRGTPAPLRPGNEEEELKNPNWQENDLGLPFSEPGEYSLSVFYWYPSYYNTRAISTVTFDVTVEGEQKEIEYLSAQTNQLPEFIVEDEDRPPMPTDLIVTAHYTDGSTEIIDSSLCTFSFNTYSFGSGDKYIFIEVVYNGTEWRSGAGYWIINGRPRLSIETIPDKTVYQLGEVPDFAGLTIKEYFPGDEGEPSYTRVVDGTVRRHYYYVHPKGTPTPMRPLQPDEWLTNLDWDKDIISLPFSEPGEYTVSAFYSYPVLIYGGPDWFSSVVTFDITVEGPAISALEVLPRTVVAGQTAYIEARYPSGLGNLDVGMMDKDGNMIGSAVKGLNGRAVFGITVPDDPGVYDVVALADGQVKAMGTIEAVPYNPDIWTSYTTVDKDGFVVINFNEAIAAKDGKFDNEAALNGKQISVKLSGDRSLVTNVKYADLPSGTNTFTITTVKYPRLYPSYSFTFTAIVEK